MSTEQIELLRASLRRCMRRRVDMADTFYATLFEIAPHTRPMFGTDIVDQTEKTMLALGAIVAQIHAIEVFGPMVSELAERHVAYGVLPEHYEAVGTALIVTLRRVFGDELSDEEEEAWRVAYDTMATVMIKAAYPDWTDRPERASA
ncbi:MAG: globin domain-containing protein [Pseudomonadota bacterium]